MKTIRMNHHIQPLPIGRLAGPIRVLIIIEVSPVGDDCCEGYVEDRPEAAPATVPFNVDCTKRLNRNNKLVLARLLEKKTQHSNGGGTY